MQTKKKGGDMSKIKRFKPIPNFSNEDEEREFWSSHDSTEYIDWSKAVPVSFPNLKLSTKTISLRLPVSVINKTKIKANQMDVPYQSLMKQYIAQGVAERPARPCRAIVVKTKKTK